MNFRHLQKLSVLYDSLLTRVPNQSLLKSAVAEIVESGLASRCVPKCIPAVPQSSELCSSSRNASLSTSSPRPILRRRFSTIKSSSKRIRNYRGSTRNISRRKSRRSCKEEEKKKTNKFQITPTKKTRARYSEEVKLKKVLSTIIRNCYRNFEKSFPRRADSSLGILNACHVECLIRREQLNNRESRKKSSPGVNLPKKILGSKMSFPIQDPRRYYSTKRPPRNRSRTNTIIRPRKSQIRTPPKKKREKIPIKDPEEPMVAKAFCSKPPCVDDPQGLPFFYRRCQVKDENGKEEEHVQRVYFLYPDKVVTTEPELFEGSKKKTESNTKIFPKVQPELLRDKNKNEPKIKNPFNLQPELLKDMNKNEFSILKNEKAPSKNLVEMIEETKNINELDIFGNTISSPQTQLEVLDINKKQNETNIFEDKNQLAEDNDVEYVKEVTTKTIQKISEAEYLKALNESPEQHLNNENLLNLLPQTENKENNIIIEYKKKLSAKSTSDLLQELEEETVVFERTESNVLLSSEQIAENKEIAEESLLAYDTPIINFVREEETTELVTSSEETYIPESKVEKEEFYLNSIKNDAEYCEKTFEELNSEYETEKTQTRLNFKHDEIEYYKQFDLSLDKVLEMDNKAEKSWEANFNEHKYLTESTENLEDDEVNFSKFGNVEPRPDKPGMVTNAKFEDILKTDYNDINNFGDHELIKDPRLFDIEFNKIKENLERANENKLNSPIIITERKSLKMPDIIIPDSIRYDKHRNIHNKIRANKNIKSHHEDIANKASLRNSLGNPIQDIKKLNKTQSHSTPFLKNRCIKTSSSTLEKKNMQPEKNKFFIMPALTLTLSQKKAEHDKTSLENNLKNQVEEKPSMHEKKRIVTFPQAEENEITKPEKKIGVLNICLKIAPPTAKHPLAIIKQKREEEKQQKTKVENPFAQLLETSKDENTKIEKQQETIQKVEKICKEELKSLQPNQILSQEPELNNQPHNNRVNFSKYYEQSEKNENIKKSVTAGQKKEFQEDKPKRVLCVIDKIWAQVEEEAKKVVKEMEVDKQKLVNQTEKLKDLDMKIAELNKKSTYTETKTKNDLNIVNNLEETKKGKNLTDICNKNTSEVTKDKYSKVDIEDLNKKAEDIIFKATCDAYIEDNLKEMQKGENLCDSYDKCEEIRARNHILISEKELKMRNPTILKKNYDKSEEIMAKNNILISEKESKIRDPTILKNRDMKIATNIPKPKIDTRIGINLEEIKKDKNLIDIGNKKTSEVTKAKYPNVTTVEVNKNAADMKFKTKSDVCIEKNIKEMKKGENIFDKSEKVKTRNNIITTEKELDKKKLQQTHSQIPHYTKSKQEEKGKMEKLKDTELNGMGTLIFDPNRQAFQVKSEKPPKKKEPNLKETSSQKQIVIETKPQLDKESTSKKIEEQNSCKTLKSNNLTVESLLGGKHLQENKMISIQDKIKSPRVLTIDSKKPDEEVKANNKKVENSQKKVEIKTEKSQSNVVSIKKDQILPGNMIQTATNNLTSSFDKKEISTPNKTIPEVELEVVEGVDQTKKKSSTSCNLNKTTSLPSNKNISTSSCHMGKKAKKKDSGSTEKKKRTGPDYQNPCRKAIFKNPCDKKKKKDRSPCCQRDCSSKCTTMKKSVTCCKTTTSPCKQEKKKKKKSSASACSKKSSKNVCCKRKKLEDPCKKLQKDAFNKICRKESREKMNAEKFKADIRKKSKQPSKCSVCGAPKKKYDPCKKSKKPKKEKFDPCKGSGLPKKTAVVKGVRHCQGNRLGHKKKTEKKSSPCKLTKKKSSPCTCCKPKKPNPCKKTSSCTSQKSNPCKKTPSCCSTKSKKATKKKSGCRLVPPVCKKSASKSSLKHDPCKKSKSSLKHNPCKKSSSKSSQKHNPCKKSSSCTSQKSNPCKKYSSSPCVRKELKPPSGCQKSEKPSKKRSGFKVIGPVCNKSITKKSSSCTSQKSNPCKALLKKSKERSSSCQKSKKAEKKKSSTKLAPPVCKKSKSKCSCTKKTSSCTSQKSNPCKELLKKSKKRSSSCEKSKKAEKKKSGIKLVPPVCTKSKSKSSQKSCKTSSTKKKSKSTLTAPVCKKASSCTSQKSNPCKKLLKKSKKVDPCTKNDTKNGPKIRFVDCTKAAEKKSNICCKDSSSGASNDPCKKNKKTKSKCKKSSSCCSSVKKSCSSKASCKKSDSRTSTRPVFVFKTSSFSDECKKSKKVDPCKKSKKFDPCKKSSSCSCSSVKKAKKKCPSSSSSKTSCKKSDSFASTKPVFKFKTTPSSSASECKKSKKFDPCKKSSSCCSSVKKSKKKCPSSSSKTSCKKTDSFASTKPVFKFKTTPSSSASECKKSEKFNPCKKSSSCCSSVKKSKKKCPSTSSKTSCKTSDSFASTKPVFKFKTTPSSSASECKKSKKFDPCKKSSSCSCSSVKKSKKKCPSSSSSKTSCKKSDKPVFKFNPCKKSASCTSKKSNPCKKTSSSTSKKSKKGGYKLVGPVCEKPSSQKFDPCKKTKKKKPKDPCKEDICDFLLKDGLGDQLTCKKAPKKKSGISLVGPSCAKKESKPVVPAKKSSTKFKKPCFITNWFSKGKKEDKKSVVSAKSSKPGIKEDTSYRRTCAIKLIGPVCNSKRCKPKNKKICKPCKKSSNKSQKSPCKKTSSCASFNSSGIELIGPSCKKYACSAQEHNSGTCISPKTTNSCEILFKRQSSTNTSMTSICCKRFGCSKKSGRKPPKNDQCRPCEKVSTFKSRKQKSCKKTSSCSCAKCKNPCKKKSKKSVTKCVKKNLSSPCRKASCKSCRKSSSCSSKKKDPCKKSPCSKLPKKTCNPIKKSPCLALYEKKRKKAAKTSPCTVKCDDSKKSTSKKSCRICKKISDASVCCGTSSQNFKHWLMYQIPKRSSKSLKEKVVKSKKSFLPPPLCKKSQKNMCAGSKSSKPKMLVPGSPPTCSEVKIKRTIPKPKDCEKKRSCAKDPCENILHKVDKKKKLPPPKDKDSKKEKSKTKVNKLGKKASSKSTSAKSDTMKLSPSKKDKINPCSESEKQSTSSKLDCRPGAKVTAPPKKPVPSASIAAMKDNPAAKFHKLKLIKSDPNMMSRGDVYKAKTPYEPPKIYKVKTYKFTFLGPRVKDQFDDVYRNQKKFLQFPEIDEVVCNDLSACPRAKKRIVDNDYLCRVEEMIQVKQCISHHGMSKIPSLSKSKHSPGYVHVLEQLEKQKSSEKMTTYRSGSRQSARNKETRKRSRCPSRSKGCKRSCDSK